MKPAYFRRVVKTNPNLLSTLIRMCLAACVLWVAGCTPEVQVNFADGSKTQRSHWDGRWLVVNYWAEWCAPCREEIPELNELHAQRTEHGLIVLGVNYDGLQDDKLKAAGERMEIDFPVLVIDPREEFGFERPQLLPVTVLISPEREVAETLVGPQTGQNIRDAIGRLKANPSEPVGASQTSSGSDTP